MDCTQHDLTWASCTEARGTTGLLRALTCIGTHQRAAVSGTWRAAKNRQ